MSSKKIKIFAYKIVHNWHKEIWGKKFNHLLNNEIIDELRFKISALACEWYYCELIQRGKLVPRSLKQKNKLSDDLTYRKFKGDFKYSRCEICSIKEPIAAAHIIPKAAGGTDSDGNLIHLCENHHYLFDRGLLTKSELKKIKWKTKSEDAQWWYREVIEPSMKVRKTSKSPSKMI